MPDQETLTPTDEEIALCAYRIWLHEGCPQGCDKEHWLKAREQLISARMKEKSAADNPSRIDQAGV
ncbi:MAG: DUF2934 domain-containing protein [Terrimicrobiaceae bacterium]